MPKIARYLLNWSDENKCYELREQGSSKARLLQDDSTWWLAWLTAHSSFSFQGQHGTLSLLKEARSRGEEGYWYAYRSQKGQTHKKYVGRTANVSVEHLESIAAALTHGAVERQSMLSVKEEESVDYQTGASPMQRDSRLLASKLHLPYLPASLITRERLLTRLDAGLEHRLTLVSAPAGFGKTTLVSQWVADYCESRYLSPVTWVSLEAADNAPHLFWRSIITACKTLHPTIGQSSLELLQSSEYSSDLSAFQPLLAQFAQEFSNETANKKVLILEDYHAITLPLIHESLAYFIDHLPLSLHLVIVTRADPPLPLARWRAHNDLQELRATDLRFSQEEAQEYLKQALSLSLDASTLQHFLARTEGWVAGMQLTVQAFKGLEDRQEIEHFLSTFNGSHRYIVEYLVAEVLNVQPEQLQTFLLQTSILNSLTGPLCDAVTGRGDSVQLLEYLERANLFLVARNGTGHWYRYYTLFAEAMQHEARRRLGEESLQLLYARASTWYEEQGMLEEAIEAAFATHDFERTAHLLERKIEVAGLSPEIQRVRQWLEQLPEEVLHARPVLDFALAVALLFTLDHHAPASRPLIEAPLLNAEQYWRSRGVDEYLGKVLTFRSLLALWQGDYKTSFTTGKQALELLPEQDVDSRGMSLLNIATMELLQGNLHVARQLLTEGRACCEAANNIYSTLAATNALGEVCARQGELHQAAQFYRQVLVKTDRGKWQEDRGSALVGLARLSYEWNKLETAEQQGKEALAISQQLPQESLRVQVALLLAHIHYARGEVESAQHTLQEMIAQTKTARLLRELQLYQARLALARGDLTTVRHWEASLSLQQTDDIFRLQQEQEALLVARLQVARGEAEAALASLAVWLRDAREMRRTKSELEILLQQAQAYGALNTLPQAREALLQALAIAQPEDYQRIFLDEGSPMETLLRTLLSDIHVQLLRSHIRHLLLAFHGHQPETAASHVTINVLSPQELRVLRLLVSGRSRAEIAQELVVSINTVKTQVKSIYRKLHVMNRQEAHEVASRLQLL